jgi:RimJ/RimL family protein N-acetyltransferase
MKVIIREAQPSDASQIIQYIQRLSKEPVSNIVISPGEFNPSVEEEAKIISEFASSENSILLVAEMDGKIIGTLNCRGRSDRKAIHHSVAIGMSVDQDWRGQGIGTLLMTNFIDWARETGFIKRIELMVFERNEIAIHLYQKFGFEIEGKHRKAIFRDGMYLDNLTMALLL